MSYERAAEDLRPNTEQWGAYESTGHCVVLAGPGSGKTKLLVTKLARVLACDVRAPRGVACLTYSNECVRELRKRVRDLAVPTDNLFLGTVHSFCLHHVIPFAALAGVELPQPVLIASDEQKKRAFGRASKLAGTASAKQKDLDDFRRDTPKRSTWDAEQPMDLLALRYEKVLRAEGLIDFEILVATAAALIEDFAWVRRCLRGKFPVLVVDEYQDLGKALHRMVEALCFTEGVRLIAVGDPNQSIYGFNGARPELLKALAARGEVAAFELELNYRSGASIINVANAVMGTRARPHTVRTASGKCTPVAGGFPEQIEVLVKKRLPEVFQRREPGDVLVTYRSNLDGATLATALRHAGIRYSLAKSDYPSSPVTRFVEEAARRSLEPLPSGRDLSALVGSWMRLCPQLDEAQARKDKAKLVRFVLAGHDPKMLAGLWLGSLPIAPARLEPSEAECLAKMETALTAGTLGNLSLKKLASQAGDPKCLNLSTLHSAKGTEYPVVILIGIDEGTLPWRNVLPGSHDEEEGRRLFFVGVSRAKDELHILHSKESPSRYVKELKQRLSQK